jgi:GPH family glycoside/pentoside/hexuronide:cation symporter
MLFMKTSDKLWYGIGPLGAQLALRLVEFAPLYFYTVAPLNLFGLYAGTALALSKIVIMIAQFGAGALSDRLKGTRFGRRKPFVLTGMWFLALSMIMLFAPAYFLPTADTVSNTNTMSYQLPLFLYMTLWVCMVNFWYGWLSTPYQAWMPELTEPGERDRLSQILNTTNMIGTAIGIIISFMFPTFIQDRNWSMILEIMIIASVLQIVFYIPAAIKILEPSDKRIKIPSIRREFSTIKSNKNYLKWILAQGILSVAFISIQSLVIGFIQYVLGFSTFLNYVEFGGAFIFVIIFSFLIWVVLYRRISKKRSLSIAMFFLAVILPFSAFIGSSVIPLPLFGQGFIYVALIAFFFAGYMLIPYIIMSDIAHEDELRTGDARAGIYMGFNSIPLNLFQVVGFEISGWLTDTRFFPAPYNFGYRLFGPILAIFILIGTMALQYVTMDFDFGKLEKQYGRKIVAK